MRKSGALHASSRASRLAAIFLIWSITLGTHDVAGKTYIDQCGSLRKHIGKQVTIEGRYHSNQQAVQVGDCWIYLETIKVGANGEGVKTRTHMGPVSQNPSYDDGKWTTDSSGFNKQSDADVRGMNSKLQNLPFRDGESVIATGRFCRVIEIDKILVGSRKELRRYVHYFFNIDEVSVTQANQ